MNPMMDGVLVLLLLTAFLTLGSSRLTATIQYLALQGVVLACLTLVRDPSVWTIHDLALAAATLALKGIGFPLLLRRTVRDAEATEEGVPFIGYTASLLIGLLLLGASLWIADRLPPPPGLQNPWMIPVGFMLIFTGLFLIVSRRRAILQVIGFMVMENGLYTFGISVAHDEPLLVEFGVMLDVFVAVFVMGIMIFHISHEFDHIDVDRLTSLKDSPP